MSDEAKTSNFKIQTSGKHQGSSFKSVKRKAAERQGGESTESFEDRIIFAAGFLSNRPSPGV